MKKSAVVVRKKNLFSKKKKSELEKLKRKVNRISKSIELKYTGSINTNTTIPSTGHFISQIIAGQIEGTTELTRIGKTTSAYDILVTMELAFIPDALVYEEFVSYWLYVDRQPNGATPAVLDVVATASYITQINNENRKRFKILKHGMIPLKTVVISAANFYAENHALSLYHSWKNNPLQILFKSNLGTVADLATNNIGMLLISKNSKAKFTSYIRVKYADL